LVRFGGEVVADFYLFLLAVNAVGWVPSAADFSPANKSRIGDAVLNVGVEERKKPT
jgi:hypothetical protein